MFLMDKDGRCEILFLVQPGKAGIEISMEWGGGLEERKEQILQRCGLSGLGFEGGIGVLQIGGNA